MFPFDPSLLPSVPTRKALLVLDLQNDFVSKDGALPVSEPAGLVRRTIEVASAFRQSGTGDVIWVRSEFEKHRPVVNDQILTSDLPMPRSMRPSSASMRARRPAAMSGKGEADDEAFLSLPGESEDADASGSGPKPECVRPGTVGSELASDVAAAIVCGRDSVLTKTHYSAFQSGKLLQLLRTRFATELYVCGALTNISIHATALDAASHGLAMTIVDDCCGYRNPTRHSNAVRNLMQITGCETTTAQDLIASLAPTSTSSVVAKDGQATVTIREKKEHRPQERPAAKTSPSSGGPIRTGSSPRMRPSSPKGSSKDRAVRDASADKTAESSYHAQEALGDLKLRDASSAAAKPDARQPQAGKKSLQPMVADPGTISAGESSGQPERPPGSTSDLEPAAPTNPAPTSQNPGRIGKAADDESPKPIVANKDHDQRPSAAKKGANDTRARTPPRNDNETVTELPDPPSSPPNPGKETVQPTKPTSKSPQEASPEVSDDPETDSLSADGEPADVAKMKEGPRPTSSDPICEGDTTIFCNLLPDSLEKGIFERLRDEVRWLRMSHQGGEVPRLVCVQGQVEEDGSMPVYRHPADESPPLVPFSPTVLRIKAEVEKTLGHSLNHVLIQFYRSGSDYISEHSDKTLDIAPGSFIANVSLGAERTMILRTKRAAKNPSRNPEKLEGGDEQQDATKRQVVRAQLPHNSLCRMGLKTNERWLHAIRQDKRSDRDKTAEELAFSGGRISLTFRKIGTFLDHEETIIWGQGATSKTREGAKPVINGQSAEAVRMLKAFGTENHLSDFDWESVYGTGFDVLHMRSSPRFFASADAVVNMRIQLMLAAFGIAYAKGSMGPASDLGERAAAVKFVDNDPGKATIQGDMAIMLYLDSVYGSDRGSDTGRPGLARELTRFQQALGLLHKWRAASRDDDKEKTAEDEYATVSETAAQMLKPLTRELAVYDAYASEAGAGAAAKADTGSCFIAGGESASIADYALWPVLHNMASSCGGAQSFASALKQNKLDHLAAYYESFQRTKCAQRMLAGEAAKASAKS